MSEDSKGFLKTSFVAVPAIQSPLIFFNEEQSLKFQDEERGVIYAPSMIPHLDIFRNNINGEPGDIYFTPEAILKMHLTGCKNNYDSNINLNHDQKSSIPDVYCFENWIIEDAVHDKSVKLGFDLPIGTLMKGYKIDNEQIKQDIKDGKITGLSVEFLPDNVVEDKEEVKLNKHDMNKKGLITLAIEAFKAAFKFSDMTDYGNGFFGSSLELGAIISDKDGNPMPNAEFEYEKNKYKTDDMGSISETEPIEEAPAEPEDDGKDAKILELETKIADLEAELTKKEEVKMANEAVIPELEAKVIKLESDLIEARKIKPIILQEDVPYEKMTNAQKVKYNRGKL